MRLFGYPHKTEADEPTPLDEVTIVASAATVRRLAEFLLHVADELERHGAAFGHEHFGDFAREMSSEPSIIVARGEE